MQGIFLHLEIQRGRIPMRQKKNSKEHRGTVGCSLRLIEATEYSGRLKEQRIKSFKVWKREVFFADSWFTSPHLVAAHSDILGHEYFGALKTPHSRTPKALVDETMKDLPSGSYLVLECKELGIFYV